MYEEALDIVRVLVTNGARPETDVALSTVIVWCDEAGFDEGVCLQGLGRLRVLAGSSASGSSTSFA
jgi:hypothetical protein